MAMTIRFDEVLDAELEAYARERKLSKQQAVVLAVTNLVSRGERAKQMDEALNLVLTRDAELMKRLADS